MKGEAKQARLVGAHAFGYVAMVAKAPIRSLYCWLGVPLDWAGANSRERPTTPRRLRVCQSLLKYSSASETCFTQFMPAESSRLKSFTYDVSFQLQKPAKD